MELIPAIDIRHGRVVRLSQGEAGRETAYGDDPVGQAEGFVAGGACWLHLVDLDRAFGSGCNAAIVAAVARQVEGRASLQVGGGLRSLDAVAEILDFGVARAVLGTLAVEDPALVPRLVARHGPHRFAVGLDARNGLVATRGWEQTSSLTVDEACRRLLAEGLSTMIYTDVTRDGMLTGPDIAGAVRLHGLGATVIVSGGVGRLEDISAVAEAGLAGVVVGRALYEGRFTLEAALEAARA